MRESQIIQQTPGLPATTDSLISDFHSLGIISGQTLLVHSSLSSLGWVVGGTAAVIHALLDTLSPSGTLVMPTHSAHLSDPAIWRNPPVPESWWRAIRQSMPAYDPQTTPTRRMGAIADTFRTFPGAIRSGHPQYSFTALGPNAKQITEDHQIGDGLGRKSPLGKLYDLNAHILLLGVTHASNTSLHLAEVLAFADSLPKIKSAAPIFQNNRREWVEFEEQEFESDDFPDVGEAFAAATYLIQSGNIAQAPSLLMPQRPLVDFATQWFVENRTCGDSMD